MEVNSAASEMRRASRQLRCSLCNEILNSEVPIVFTLRCRKCNEIQRYLRCGTCRYSEEICDICSLRSEESRSLKENFDSAPQQNNVKFYNSGWIFAAGFTLVFIIIAFYYRNALKENKSIDENNFIKKLKTLYPSQRAETWHHFLSVLENKDLTVKSITFIHNEDKTTLDCLIGELVSRFSGSKNINIEEITFSEVGFEGVDYGLVLEHYHAIVKKFRVFRADLTKISGKHARIFHSLCDEVSSDVKPSLFIFTIKCNKSTKNLKPLERATTALKESWNDLSSSELFPLLSRVIKNVVEIIPEAQSLSLFKIELKKKSSDYWEC